MKIKMEFSIIIIALNVGFVFMFKIDWLQNSKSYVILMILNLVLFFLSYYFEYHSFEFKALKIPLISQLIFLILNTIFSVLLNRKPVNTFWHFSKMKIEDVIFSLLFWIFGIGGPFIITKIYF
jgi:hypothetical protein